jgi:hypothetical protein
MHIFCLIHRRVATKVWETSLILVDTYRFFSLIIGERNEQNEALKRSNPPSQNSAERMTNDAAREMTPDESERAESETRWQTETESEVEARTRAFELVRSVLMDCESEMRCA